MSYKQLFIFVEGIDDERFVNQVIKPVLQAHFHYIKIIKYAVMTKTEVAKLVNTCKQKEGLAYLFFCDMDARGNKDLCISKRKEKEQNKYGNCLEMDRIVVVKEEIESWYLAGIAPVFLEKCKIKPFTDTENISKEMFEKMIPKNFISPNDFMVEMLKSYSIEQATKINLSFNYFKNKHLSFS